MQLTELLDISDSDFKKLIEGLSVQKFYDPLESPDFKAQDAFTVNIPFKFGDKKVELHVPVKFELGNLEKEVDQYLKAPPDLKKKFDTYAYWYDNFNKLIFDNLEESDACLFLAACAFCSANTALDQNILEAAKLFQAVKHDMTLPNGSQMLSDLSTHVKDNMKNETLQYLNSYKNKGSAYADLLTPKKDYKGGIVGAGARKGQDDVFSEITVSNAKIPNFNLFVKYYLSHGGKVTKSQLFSDLKGGKFSIGGTKINSFFLNLVFPGTKWDKNIDPATIDRWMIRVFFDKPLEKMVEEDVTDWIQEMTNQMKIKASKTDTDDTLAKKKVALLQKNKDGIVNETVMQLFGRDDVRQTLIKILHEHANKMGLTSYQLQALAWVNIRVRYKEPAAKFAKFEDVMAYAEDAARGIVKLDPNVNSVMRTIKILASGPRFKFKDKQDVIDTIQNRDAYEKVYFLPPKNDVEKKANQKAAMAAEKWTKMKVAMKSDQSADIFDLSKSGKVPVFAATGADKRATLNSALQFILKYNPVS